MNLQCLTDSSSFRRFICLLEPLAIDSCVYRYVPWSCRCCYRNNAINPRSFRNAYPQRRRFKPRCCNQLKPSRTEGYLLFVDRSKGKHRHQSSPKAMSLDTLSLSRFSSRRSGTTSCSMVFAIVSSLDSSFLGSFFSIAITASLRLNSAIQGGSILAGRHHGVPSLHDETQYSPSQYRHDRQAHKRILLQSSLWCIPTSLR